MPLVATKEILAAYTYLPEDAVYLQMSGETELEVVSKILRSKSKARRDKKAIVREQCAKIIDGNVKLIEGWLQKVLPKISL